MRDHLFGEQSHRVLDHGVVHDPALIEIANELVHAVLTTEFLYPVYAITGIAEHPDLAVEIFVLHAFESGQDLAERLKPLDVGVAERSVQPRGLTQKAQQTRLAVSARLRPARSNVDRESERDIRPRCRWGACHDRPLIPP
jgi:hypothetical protein